MKKISAFRLLLLTIIFSCSNNHTHTVKIVYKHKEGTSVEESEIISYKKNLSLIAQLKTNGKINKEVKLTEGYMPIITTFVTELQSLSKEKKCLTVDSYTVYIDGQIITGIDRTCEWKGFERLKRAFFDSANK